MAAALSSVNPATVKDPKAFAALMVDAGNLMTRINAATTRADAAIKLGAYAVTPLAYTPGQGAYDALLKAIRQNAPPDGAPLQRGDLDDVVNRISQVGGVKVDFSQMPQPRAKDPDQQFITTTAPLAHAVDDAYAAAKAAAEAAAKDGKDAFDFLKWMHDHKTEVMVVSLLIGGIIVWQMLPHVIPAAKLAGKAYLLPEATAATAVKHAARTMLLGA
jgi:hypothetical protein